MFPIEIQCPGCGFRCGTMPQWLITLPFECPQCKKMWRAIDPYAKEIEWVETKTEGHVEKEKI